jgi:hypothetical protein
MSKFNWSKADYSNTDYSNYVYSSAPILTAAEKVFIETVNTNKEYMAVKTPSTGMTTYIPKDKFFKKLDNMIKSVQTNY